MSSIVTFKAEIRIETGGYADVIDISDRVGQAVRDSGVSDGIVCVANPGSTAGITTIEFEPGAVADLKRALEQLAPQKGRYEHDATWGDGNGSAHLRSAILGASKSFPVVAGRIALGTWQQVVFVDFDNRSRTRVLQVVVTGD